MSFKTFLIYTLSCLTIFRYGATDSQTNTDIKKKNVTQFLEHVKQKHNEVISRQVWIDNEETTINDFISQPDINFTLDIKWNNKRHQNFNKLIHLLSISVSCEYSESTFFLVKMIQKAYNMINVENSDVTNTLESYWVTFFHPIQEHLSNMILTLAGLLEFIHHFSSKEHELLTILLSWHINIKNSVNKKTYKNIESIRLTTYQVEIHLKQFIINNCRRIEVFGHFQNGVNYNMSMLNNFEELQQSFESKCFSLDEQVNYQILFQNKQNNVFVLTSDRSYFNTLLELISRELPNGSLYNNWDSDIETVDLITFYDKVDNASDIKTILKYERTILQIITKIIISYVSNILKSIITMPAGTDIKTKCNEMLMTKLVKYLKKFNEVGQPLFLLNSMLIIKDDVWTACFLGKSFEEKKTNINKHIEKLKKIEIKGFVVSDFDKFETFLEKLSETLIYTILHPSVSFAFWKKLYFATTSISEHVIDLKTLHVNPEEIDSKIDNCCVQLSFISNKLKTLNNNINNYFDQNYSSDSRSEELLTDLYQVYNHISTNLAEIIVSNNCEITSFHWKKLLLTIFYNSNDDKQIKPLPQISLLHNRINDFFNDGYDMTCQLRPLSNQVKEINSSSSPTKRRRDFNIFMNEKLNDIIGYTTFFRAINQYGVKLIDNSNFHEEEFKLMLYYDNIKMTIEDVQARYNNHSIDHLQDNYDYFKYLVRWIPAVVFIIIKDIVNVIESSYPSIELPNETEVQLLAVKFDASLDLPLYSRVPIKTIFDNFLSLLKPPSYDDQTIWKQEFDYFQKTLRKRLMSFGVPIEFLANKKDDNDVSFLIKRLVNVVDYLTVNYADFKSTIESEANRIGIEKDYSLMKFRAWY